MNEGVWSEAANLDVYVSCWFLQLVLRGCAVLPYLA